jgi:hypothetical protein
MRSSVRKSDPGYRRNYMGTTITLDGVPVPLCVTADEELGEVLCLVRTPEGGKKMNAAGTGAEEVVHRGVVVITPPKGQRKPKRRWFVRMFKERFAPLVEAGTKLNTVRPEPKRRPVPGDITSLRVWRGEPYRSKQRILRTAMITAVRDILITENYVWYLEKGERVSASGDLDDFARRDGFADFRDMQAWFNEEHGLPFVGIAIFWAC